MGRKITVILRNGTELIYKNARVVEGNKTWIYQVNKNERPEELLAFLDPNHITKLYTEEDWYLPWLNQQVGIGLMRILLSCPSEYSQCISVSCRPACDKSAESKEYAKWKLTLRQNVPIVKPGTLT